jgi:hypothetical protein
MKKKGLFLACLTGLCLCSGCKSGWPAIPLQSGTDKKIVAARTDARGCEVSRLEWRDKERKWQFLFSPEGPVQDSYAVWDRIYEVTGSQEVRVPFLSTKGEGYRDVFYHYYFPVGQRCWVGLKYDHVGVGDRTLDLRMMIFTAREVISKFMIPAVAEEKGLRDILDPWKLDEQNKQLLRIETLKGLVVFDLQKGEFVVGKELVTELSVGK